MAQRRVASKNLVKLAARRRLAYQDAFLGPDKKPHAAGEAVLADLKKFCRGDGRSTFVRNDPYGRESALLEGRREVWNRILLYLNLTEEDIRFLQEQLPSELQP